MLHLNDLTKQGPQSRALELNERLPDFLTAPCHVNISYHVELKDKFFLIHLQTQADLKIICQRCMNEFPFSYENNTEIGVCKTDERAEQLLEHYECIVSTTGQVELEDLIIDELHLYVPIFHPQVNDCGSEINHILASQIETY